MNTVYSVLTWLFLFVKEKFKVKLTEYMIRRIMLELSLCPDGMNRRILGIYPRIGAFCFGSPIWEFKYIYEGEIQKEHQKTGFVDDRKKGVF